MIQLRKGFTLIELLVVIAIVGVLTTSIAAILNPSEQFKKARDAQRKQDLRQIQTPLQAYYADKGRFPAVEAQHIKDAPWGGSWPSYMPRVPKDPLSPNPDYLYESDAGGTYYRLYAKLENCKDPQKMPDAQCGSYNYSVTSSNIAIAIFITPNPTPTPTITPTPTFKRVFVTPPNYDGNLGGPTGGDAKCKSVADKPGSLVQGKTWKAWLSTSTENAIDRIYPPGAGKDNTGYILVNNLAVTTSKTDLQKGSIASPINKDANGNTVVNRNVWTGTKSDGTVIASNTCNDWADDTINMLGRMGAWYATDTNWTDISVSDNCNDTLRLYCFEE